MKNKKLHVAVSPLTNTIFAGHILQRGTWGAGKQDVTMPALISVAEHVLAFGAPVVISDGERRPIYTITVERHDSATSHQHEWKCVSPGTYDTTYVCTQCGARNVEQIDNLLDTKNPEFGCSATSAGGEE